MIRRALLAMCKFTQLWCLIALDTFIANAKMNLFIRLHKMCIVFFDIFQWWHFFFFVRLFAEEAATWQSYRPATKAKIYWIFIVVRPLFGLMFPFISHIATVTFYCVRSKNQVKLQWVRLSSPVFVSAFVLR